MGIEGDVVSCLYEIVSKIRHHLIMGTIVFNVFSFIIFYQSFTGIPIIRCITFPWSRVIGLYNSCWNLFRNSLYSVVIISCPTVDFSYQWLFIFMDLLSSQELIIIRWPVKIIKEFNRTYFYGHSIGFLLLSCDSCVSLDDHIFGWWKRNHQCPTSVYLETKTKD